MAQAASGDTSSPVTARAGQAFDTGRAVSDVETLLAGELPGDGTPITELPD
ncbi:hypothetical protein [Micromonospora sp. NPDC005220]|uniref:hypothetical protein n=1 Tax=Micromonospora sp. NPDC005220 TaxID=3155589 RepID=UPI0033B7235F